MVNKSPPGRGVRRQTHPLIPSKEGTSCSWRIRTNGHQSPRGVRRQTHPLIPSREGTSCSWRIRTNGHQSPRGVRRQTHPLIPSKEGTSYSMRKHNNDAAKSPPGRRSPASDPTLNPLQGGDFHIQGVSQVPNVFTCYNLLSSGKIRVIFQLLVFARRMLLIQEVVKKRSRR